MRSNPDEAIRRLEQRAAQGDRRARVQLLREHRRRGLPDPIWTPARKLAARSRSLMSAALHDVLGRLVAMLQDQRDNRDRPDRDDAPNWTTQHTLWLIDEIVEAARQNLSDDGPDEWVYGYASLRALTENRSNAFTEGLLDDLIRRAGKILKQHTRAPYAFYGRHLPSNCARCGHAWSSHSDAESMEDERVGVREPCGTCPCPSFVYA